MRELDPIRVIERAYERTEDISRWWASMVEIIAPQIDRGGGMFAYRMPLDTLRPVEFVDMGAPPVAVDVTRQGAERADRREALRAVDPAGLHASTEVFPGVRFPSPMADALALSIPDGEGSLHVLVSVSPRRERVDEEAKLVWRQLALHLGAGIRLQRQDRSLSDPEVEAVLSPDGSLLHAASERTSASSREHLREATRRIDRLRTARGRASAHESLELWRGLVLGRWSMVDHFDTDGRHFLVARRNDPDAPAPRQLSRRQRQVVFYASLGLPHKHVGYALGLAETTVANHLREALAKLGIESREELIKMVGRIAP